MKRGKKSRVERAQARLAESDGRTPQQQIERLDLVFGPGKGAEKERAKLARRIEDTKNPQKGKPEEQEQAE
jgi:hypothetical protein